MKISNEMSISILKCLDELVCSKSLFNSKLTSDEINLITDFKFEARKLLEVIDAKVI